MTTPPNDLPFTSMDFTEAWEAFLQHRKEIHHTVKPTGRAALLKKLKSFGEKSAVLALWQSIENGWQGVFAPKPNGNGKYLPTHAEMNAGGRHKLVI